MHTYDASPSTQIKDITRQIKKAVVASNLRELQRKSAEKFGMVGLPRIHLDSDGTEIDDEDYFQTLEPNTELIVVFSGEQWVDVSESARRVIPRISSFSFFSTADAISHHHDAQR